MNSLKSTSIAAAAAILMVSVSATAAVNVDEQGVGFVGKGDVQSIYNWNNSMLQSNAHLVQFKFSAAGTISWYCEGVNAAGHTVTTNVRNEDIEIGSLIAFDARRNRNGQITGFILSGFENNMTTFNNIGNCGRSVGFQVPFAPVSEINYDGSSEPSLKVSIDGQTWFDLTITY